MIFQLSDWFPKPMIWAIIIKFDQIRKNWWRISCAEILEVGKKFFAAPSVKKMSQFEEVSPEKIERIAWKFTKTVILLGLARYELIIYISLYPARPQRITVKYYFFWGRKNFCINLDYYPCLHSLPSPLLIHRFSRSCHLPSLKRTWKSC